VLFLVRCEETTWGAFRPDCCQEDGPPYAGMTPFSRAAPYRGQVCPTHLALPLLASHSMASLATRAPPGQCPARAGPQRASWAARHHPPNASRMAGAGSGHVRHARGCARSHFLAVVGHGPYPPTREMVKGGELPCKGKRVRLQH